MSEDALARGVDKGGSAPYGEAITLAKSKDEKEHIHEKYILGEPEEIVSKLSDDLVLRTAALSLIASGFVRTEDSLKEFFENSFYGHQYGNDWGFKMRISEALRILVGYEFIQKIGDKYEPTRVGRRVSELYIDPDTAHILVTGLKEFREGMPVFSLLHLLSCTPEMWPGLNLRKADWEWVEEELIERESSLIQKIPKEWDPQRDRFMRAVKLALMFQDWADERSEQNILEKYNVRPGELRAQVHSAEWLLYGCFEITRLLNNMDRLSSVNKARFRMKYGVREELMPLVKLRGVGRYRARKLYTAKIKNIRDLKKANPEKVKELLGKKIGESVLKQV